MKPRLSLSCAETTIDPKQTIQISDCFKVYIRNRAIALSPKNCILAPQNPVQTPIVKFGKVA
ncbi:hypothetical protein [Coleofasciculus sp. H7-2]|uniref:hypothetical protein n=1 Tax=Coleofasciculus sp. H7-2 TaxID=3351545 RepID=UPI00366EBF7E